MRKKYPQRADSEEYRIKRLGDLEFHLRNLVVDLYAVLWQLGIWSTAEEFEEILKQIEEK